MTDSKKLDVRDIDFDSIRSNLREFLRSQDTLQDYDFDGSAISSFIDLLAYATHYNAVNANIGLNETFLDTAQFRGSVVGRAREKSYTPQSARAPVAFLDVTVTNAGPDDLLTIPRGHRFKSKINNTSYTFIATDDFTTTGSTFTDVRVAQAELKTAEYIFDRDSAEKFLIPDENVDTSTVRVEVFDSPGSTTSQIYVPIKTLIDIDSQSNGYFLSENPEGLFEISFGDGVVGTQPSNGSLVRIEYGTTKKGAANGARVFSMVDPIDSFTEVSIATAQSARGGSERETIESIKQNAPLTFVSQNRGVTPQDFEAIIRENFANLDSVKAWGGENNDPPVYGKVFISIKPQNAEILTTQEKSQILEDIIEPKSVVTITPEIIDPEFTFIGLDVFFKFDPTRTSLSRKEIETAVKNAVLNFNESELNRFSKVFRHSSLLSVIDNAEASVLNSTARVFVKKRFVPILDTPNRYVLNFSGDLVQAVSDRRVIVSSSPFLFNGLSSRFKDVPDPNRKNRRIVQVVTGDGPNEVVLKSNTGFIEGPRIVIENFTIASFQGAFIEIAAVPASNDIAPRLNNILTIDPNDLSVVGDVDTIVAGRDFSGVDYNTTPRNA